MRIVLEHQHARQIVRDDPLPDRHMRQEAADCRRRERQVIARRLPDRGTLGAQQRGELGVVELGAEYGRRLRQLGQPHRAKPRRDRIPAVRAMREIDDDAGQVEPERLATVAVEGDLHARDVREPRVFRNAGHSDLSGR